MSIFGKKRKPDLFYRIVDRIERAPDCLFDRIDRGYDKIDRGYDNLDRFVDKLLTPRK